jgi:hypothetical protein
LPRHAEFIKKELPKNIVPFKSYSVANPLADRANKRRKTTKPFFLLISKEICGWPNQKREWKGSPTKFFCFVLNYIKWLLF